jgi:hypothetical protein
MAGEIKRTEEKIRKEIIDALNSGTDWCVLTDAFLEWLIDENRKNKRTFHDFVWWAIEAEGYFFEDGDEEWGKLFWDEFWQEFHHLETIKDLIDSIKYVIGRVWKKEMQDFMQYLSKYKPWIEEYVDDWDKYCS